MAHFASHLTPNEMLWWFLPTLNSLARRHRFFLPMRLRHLMIRISYHLGPPERVWDLPLLDALQCLVEPRVTRTLVLLAISVVKFLLRGAVLNRAHRDQHCRCTCREHLGEFGQLGEGDLRGGGVPGQHEPFFPKTNSRGKALKRNKKESRRGWD